MRLRTALAVAFLGLAAWSVLPRPEALQGMACALSTIGRGEEQFPLPNDYEDKHEWTRARLRYSDLYGYPDRCCMYYGPNFPGYWTMDFPLLRSPVCWREYVDSPGSTPNP